MRILIFQAICVSVANKLISNDYLSPKNKESLVSILYCYLYVVLKS